MKTLVNIHIPVPKALLVLLMMCFNFFLKSQTSDVPVIEKYVVNYDGVSKMRFINDSVLYSEGWHTLPQPKFWQQIMLLSPDSAIVSSSGNRQILDRLDMKQWNKLSDLQHALYRDSIRHANNIADSTNIFVTAGKILDHARNAYWRVHVLLFRHPVSNGDSQSVSCAPLVCARDFGLLRRCLVWNSN